MKSFSLFAAALVFFASFLSPAPVSAQDASVGVLLIAHGAGPEWNAQVETIASLTEVAGPIEVSYLMGPGASANPFQQAAQRLVDQGAREIVVVPMLISSHSSHYGQIRYLAGEDIELSETMHHHLHMAGIEPASVNVPIRVAPAIDDSPEAAQVLAERALALADAPGEQALFLIAHGPNSAEDNAEWLRNLHPLANHVETAGGFRSVMVGTIRDDAPATVRAEAVRAIRAVIELQHEATGQPVVVVPVLISTGQVSREKIPRDLEGLPIVYSGDALLPHPGLARWVEARVREGAALVDSASSSNPESPGHSSAASHQ